MASAPTTLESDAGSVAMDSSEAVEDARQLVSFRLDSEEYGLDIMCVQEIILLGRMTAMPQVPDYVRGLINLRGHVIPIVDLRKKFGLRSADPTEDSRIIVLNVEQRTVGIIVDQVNEVLRVDPKQITPAPKGVASVERQYLDGIARLENRLLILLNIEVAVAEDVGSSPDAASS